MRRPEAWNVEQIGQTDLGGHGDCMHVNVVGDLAYVGHMGDDRIGTSVVDVSDPSEPRVVTQLETPPGTHSHKVQVVDDLLLVNYERNPAERRTATRWEAGLKIFDISDPVHPRPIGFLRTPGKGVHRMTFTELPYVYMSASDEGYTDQFFLVADLSDPANPVEVGRWWYPGMYVGGGEIPTWPEHRQYKHHHALPRDDRAYATWWDGGLVALDISDLERPTPVGFLQFPEEESSFTHTALPLPGRDLLVVTDEALGPRDGGIQKQVRVVDISNGDRMEVVSKFPVPEGDFAGRPGRFGPHNLHEMRPGTFRSSSIVHLTYFNAGLRIYDVTDATEPREIASFVPPPHGDAPAIQFNDLTVAESGLIYVTDRVAGGLYILQASLPV